MADPKKWGPGLWTYLHALPRHSRDLDSLRATLENLDLPCADCRKHYRGFIASKPVGIIRTREEGERWVFDLHNSVNKKLGKPAYTFEACQGDCDRISETSPPARSLYF